MLYFGAEDPAYSSEGNMCELGMPNDVTIFLSHLGFFAIAIIWITLKFPERWFPGKLGETVFQTGISLTENFV